MVAFTTLSAALKGLMLVVGHVICARHPKKPTRIPYTMAHPKSPGSLPRTVYNDMSSMYISSHRAGHANASPYQHAPYAQRPDTVGSTRMSVPSELYSGMSSMQVSSPYQSHASLPPDAQAALGRDDRRFGGSVYPSNYAGTHHSHYGHGNTSTRALQHDCKMPVKESVIECADHSSQRRVYPSTFGLGDLPPGIAADIKHMDIKTEDAESCHMDIFERDYPQSSRYGLQAVLDEENARDELAERSTVETEEKLQRELAERPNDPLLLERFRRHRSLARMHVQLKEIHNDMLGQAWFRSGRVTQRPSGMAYPNTPGGLPSTLYRDMSSLRIASPRAGHARASPYPYPSDNAHAIGSPRRSLPPDMYSGMSSMHVSSPYQGHSSLPPDGHPTHLRTPPDRRFNGSHHTLNYPGIDNRSQTYGTPSARILQHRDCKMAMIGSNAEPARHSLHGQERPTISIHESSIRYSDAAEIRGHIKSEDMESQDWDFLEQVYPQSSKISLQAVLDEDARDEDCDEKSALGEEILLRQLAEHPNNPSYLTQPAALRSLKQVNQNQKELLRRITKCPDAQTAPGGISLPFFSFPFFPSSSGSMKDEERGLSAGRLDCNGCLVQSAASGSFPLRVFEAPAGDCYTCVVDEPRESLFDESLWDGSPHEGCPLLVGDTACDVLNLDGGTAGRLDAGIFCGQDLSEAFQ
ncbi:hypothetical protein EVG20_g10267 [Dentipellis fragilis]|uniref:Uncharacterized protein n=1 Tax=Dentipellis fragilis TaxID=205917 RepID=A0A4Y9XVB9_9AGAM|nr:hypothetical protein EVG20_g10267 [Dentipellis fragilis]